MNSLFVRPVWAIASATAIWAGRLELSERNRFTAAMAWG